MQEQAAEHEAISDDQKLLSDLDSLVHADPMVAARRFVGQQGGGESEFEVLNRFFENNEDHMSDAVAGALKNYIKLGNREATEAIQSGNEQQAASLKNIMLTMLIPTIASHKK